MSSDEPPCSAPRNTRLGVARDDWARTFGPGTGDSLLAVDIRDAEAEFEWLTGLERRNASELPAVRNALNQPIVVLTLGKSHR